MPPDFSSSFEIKDYQNYINYFKKIFMINNNINQSLDEMNYGKEMHKFAVLNKNVKKGKKINYSDLKFLRINEQGFSRINLNKMVKKKKKYKKNYFKNEILQ